MTLKEAEERKDDIWEVKYDGCHGILIKHKGKAYGFSRQGEEISGAMDRQLDAMEAIGRDNFVLFVEGWNPFNIHSTLNGDFRRGYEDGELRSVGSRHFRLCEICSDFMEGVANVAYEDRKKEIKQVLKELEVETPFYYLFRVAAGFETKAQAVDYVASQKEELEFAVDGFIRKARKGIWTAGAGTCGSVIKDKKSF